MVFVVLGLNFVSTEIGAFQEDIIERIDFTVAINVAGSFCGIGKFERAEVSAF